MLGFFICMISGKWWNSTDAFFITLYEAETVGALQKIHKLVGVI